MLASLETCPPSRPAWTLPFRPLSAVSAPCLPLGSTAAGSLLPRSVVAGDDTSDDDSDAGGDDDLESIDPLDDEDENFDDFDDDFDDDFEEDESDPDWDHPADLQPEAPPPGKPASGKK